MKKMRQRIACKAVILYDSKILILREAAAYADGTNIGRYNLPGGRIEPGEKYMDGLAREVLEETGLQVNVGKPIFVGEWFPVIRGEQNQIVAIFFACTTTNNRVILSGDHDDYRWVDPTGHKQYALIDPEDQVLEAYLTAQCLTNDARA